MHRVLLVSLFVMACPRVIGGARTELVVIAPHPDDEVLMAEGLISQTIARGERVVVVLVTNGDATCKRDGALREAETMEAMRELGVRDVRFLGFPDGALSALTASPLGPRPHLFPDGGCGALSETWADERLGLTDEHTRRTGMPSSWTDSALEEALVVLLDELAPRQVVVSHGADEHPDHAMTYVFFRRALDRSANVPEIVRRSLVHVGEQWPATHPFSADALTPSLPAPLDRYAPNDRLSIDAAAKLRAIGHYRSQLDAPLPDDWLAGFARADEIFFRERLVRDGPHWVQAGSRPRGDERVLELASGLEEVNLFVGGRLKAALVRPSSSRSTPPSPE